MKIVKEDFPWKQMVNKGDVSANQVSEMIYWQNRVADVLAAAAQRGVVITVNNPPLQPPAMGNYDLVVTARPLRNFKG